MQRAANWQQFRYLPSFFNERPLFLLNASCLQSSKRSTDNNVHLPYWSIHKVFWTCYPSTCQSCPRLSLFIRGLCSATLLPSLVVQDFDVLSSAAQVNADRDSLNVTEDSCAQELNTRELIRQNNTGSVERSEDMVFMEAKSVITSSDFVSDTCLRQIAQQVGQHACCRELQESECRECANTPSLVEKVRDAHEGSHVKLYDTEVSATYNSSDSCNSMSQTGELELCKSKNGLATAESVAKISSQSNYRDFRSPCVDSVLLQLDKDGWGHHTELLLHRIVKVLNTGIVEKIVHGLKNAKVAFSFLQWVGTQENYQHNEEVFTKVISRLGTNGDFETAFAVLLYMKKYDLKVDYAFGVFIYQLKSKNFVDHLVRAMDSMKSLDVCPTVSLYTVALQATLKASAFKIAERLYKEMRDAGLQLDAKLSGVLITGFGKAGMADRALFFFNEMQRDGVPPDSFVYTRLIRAFAVAGQFVEGQNFFVEMVQNKCLPVSLSRADLECALFGVNSMPPIYLLLENLESSGHRISVHTCNSIIQYLLDKKMLLEAVEVFRKLLDSGNSQESNSQSSIDNDSERPNKVSYSLLICGLSKGGQLTEAILLFKEMLLKGIGTTSDLCNCLLYGLSSTEGFLFEAMEVARHVARQKLNVNSETGKAFFEALKAHGDFSKALKCFEMMKRRGCIDLSSNFDTF